MFSLGSRKPSNSFVVLVLWMNLLVSKQCCDARPEFTQEQTLGYYNSFLKGSYVGFQTLLALMGYYESEDVKEALREEELYIDAEEREDDRSTIQVVGLGLGRTGTTSLAIALEILGYMVIHDDEQTELTDLYYFWDEEEIDQTYFHEIVGLRGYNATFKTADHRWVATQPSIKAILTVRDTPDKYVDSWLVAAPFIDICEMAPFKWMATVDELIPALREEFQNETTNGNTADYLDREVLKNNYVRYNEEVQDTIPEDRLLTFNVKDGWGPLCDYLGVPVPAGIPFPHVHTRAKLEGEMFFLRSIAWLWTLGELAALIAVYEAAKWVLRRCGAPRASTLVVAPSKQLDRPSLGDSQQQ